MQFWRISEPEYESDYDHTFINGSLDHPFGVPGVKCDLCGQTWGGSKVLPFECPNDLRNHKNIKDAWPVSVEENEKLQSIIKDLLGISNIELRPGYRLQPSFLDIPSNPNADFLWSSIETVLVSERIKNFFLKASPNEVAFVKTNKRKIGSKMPVLPSPIPSTGEPEDIIDEIELLSNTASIQEYYEMIPKFESKMPINTKTISTCKKCGREEIDGESRILLMEDSVWNSQSIFYFATTLYIIVTDEIKRNLEKLGATNIRFVDITKNA